MIGVFSPCVVLSLVYHIVTYLMNIISYSLTIIKIFPFGQAIEQGSMDDIEAKGEVSYIIRLLSTYKEEIVSNRYKGTYQNPFFFLYLLFV